MVSIAPTLALLAAVATRPALAKTECSAVFAAAMEADCATLYCPQPNCDDTVCGSNGKTYSNQCLLKKDQCSDASITLASKGACPTPAPTTTTHAPDAIRPVCLSDGHVYTTYHEYAAHGGSAAFVSYDKCPDPMPTTATPTVATTPTPPKASAWGQCGGNGWTGPTACVDGTTCVKLNDWYSQCLSTSAPSAITTSPVSIEPTVEPTVTPTTTKPPCSYRALMASTGRRLCSPNWSQCGGIGWNGPTTCPAGQTCTFMNDYYSQCL